MESLRTSLLQQHNLRIYVAANLDALPTNPHHIWKEKMFKDKEVEELVKYVLFCICEYFLLFWFVGKDIYTSSVFIFGIFGWLNLWCCFIGLKAGLVLQIVGRFMNYKYLFLQAN